jgi:hypothetical protein
MRGENTTPGEQRLIRTDKCSVKCSWEHTLFSDSKLLHRTVHEIWVPLWSTNWPLPSIIWYKRQLLIILLINQLWKLFLELHQFILDKEMCPTVTKCHDTKDLNSEDTKIMKCCIHYSHGFGCLNCYPICVTEEHSGNCEDVTFLGHAWLLKKKKKRLHIVILVFLSKLE